MDVGCQMSDGRGQEGTVVDRQTDNRNRPDEKPCARYFVKFTAGKHLSDCGKSKYLSAGRAVYRICDCRFV